MILFACRSMMVGVCQTDQTTLMMFHVPGRPGWVTGQISSAHHRLTDTRHGVSDIQLSQVGVFLASVGSDVLSPPQKNTISTADERSCREENRVLAVKEAGRAIRILLSCPVTTFRLESHLYVVSQPTLPALSCISGPSPPPSPDPTYRQHSAVC